MVKVASQPNDLTRNLFKKDSIKFTAENSSSLLIAILLFILPLIYIDSIRDFSSLPRYAFYGISSGIIFSFLLIIKLTEANSLHLPKLFFIAIAFLCWSWLSLIWSSDPKNALIELTQLTGCIIIGYAITQINKFQLIKWLVISSVAGGTLAAAIGVAQYFNYNPFHYRQFSVPASTFTNPNFATIYLDLITPVAFSLIFIANKYSFKVLAAVSSILCLSFLLISHSRGSWLGLVFILIALFVLLFKNYNFKINFIPAVKQNKFYLLASILIPFLIFSIASSVTTQPLKNSQLAFDGSSKIRLHAYINSLSILKDHPVVGTGYGSFKSEFRDNMFNTVPFTQVTEDKTLLRLHNDPLQFFVELGIIGGLLFIFIYLIILQACWKIIKTTNSPPILFLTSAIFLAIIANGIHACVDFPFRKPTSALQFWVWFGTIIAISGTVIPTKLFNLNKKIVVLMIIFGLTFSIYNFKYYQNYLEASHYRYLTEQNIKEKNCISAKKNVDKMMSLFDAEFHHQSLYVDVYSRCTMKSNESLSAMNRILNYDKTNTRAYITRGTIYLQQKSTQNALDDFLQVTRILPHRASGYIGLAYVSLQHQNIAAAIKQLKYALKAEPKNKMALNLLGKIMQK